MGKKKGQARPLEGRSRPRYVKRILRMIATGEARIVPGVVNHIEVRHEPWCSIWETQECNCTPDIAMKEDRQN